MTALLPTKDTAICTATRTYGYCVHATFPLTFAVISFVVDTCPAPPVSTPTELDCLAQRTASLPEALPCSHL